MEGKYTLLVEDNPDEVALAELAFDKSQVSNGLVVVRDGREALDYLFHRGKYTQRDPREPALILLDLNLPLLSGFEVLKEIRNNETTSKIPVVVLTSSTEPSDRFESARLGANEYIHKPTAFYQFVEIVARLKSCWLNSNGDLHATS